MLIIKGLLKLLFFCIWLLFVIPAGIGTAFTYLLFGENLLSYYTGILIIYILS